MTTVLTLTVLESRLTPTVRILPLGDSITQGGYFNSASYRYPLWEQLQQAGDSNIDFVGSHNTVYNEGPGNPSLANYPNYYTSFDRDNDGYWGYRTDQVLPLMPSIAAADRPDIVMLMLGTNDLGQMGQAGVAPAAANLGLIIDGLRAVNPAVDVLLAEIIPIGPNAGSYYTTGSAWVNGFNAQVVAVAAAKNTPQSPVVVVDQFAGFNMSTDLSSDGVHPSRAGESRIANNFFQALAPYLGDPVNQPPVIGNQAFSINENSSNGTAVGTVAATDPDAGQTLSYQIIGGNLGGAFAANAATGQLTVATATALDFETTPTFTLTVRVTDNGTPARSSTATVTINLNNVIEAPVNRVPSAPQAVAKNKTLVFSSANGNAISISDPDAGSTLIQVSLSVNHGTLTMGGFTGLTFQVGDGKDDATMTFRGTVAAINAALNGLKYAVTNGYTGSDGLAITSNDLGHGGLGSPLTDTDVVAIFVQKNT